MKVTNNNPNYSDTSLDSFHQEHALRAVVKKELEEFTLEKALKLKKKNCSLYESRLDSFNNQQEGLEDIIKAYRLRLEEHQQELLSAKNLPKGNLRTEAVNIVESKIKVDLSNINEVTNLKTNLNKLTSDIILRVKNEMLAEEFKPEPFSKKAAVAAKSKLGNIFKKSKKNSQIENRNLSENNTSSGAEQRSGECSAGKTTQSSAHRSDIDIFDDLG